MIYIGIDAESVLLFHVFRGFMDRYIHSNLNGPRWVHKFMVSSPYFHRWHHANDPQARDKNFSGDFIFLDVLFGTAYDPDPKIKPLPKQFGEPNYSNNFFVQQIIPFSFLYKRFKRSKSYQWLSTHLSSFSKSSS
jgi:sterol desaturase/sphingolipid hydroxylase (fatty acid hydroxylase superfamily)